jgi:streptomycin 6-kinase
VRVLLDYPVQTRAHLEAAFGASGKAWADGVTDLLKACCERWRLEPMEWLAGGLKQNLVLEVKEDGRPAILKLGYPDADQLSERQWLLAQPGSCCAKLLDDLEFPVVLLIERVMPGRPLVDAIRGESWTIDRHSELAPLLSACMHDASRAVESVSYDHLLTRVLDNPSQAFPRDLLERVSDAQDMLVDLNSGPMGESRWLHGDLHAGNILWDETIPAWRAIDPKGYVGPAVMNVGRYLHNFLADELTGRGEDRATPAQVALCEARAQVLAKALEAPYQTLLKATLIDLTLSTAWHVQSEGMAVWESMRALLDGLRDRC